MTDILNLLFESVLKPLLGMSLTAAFVAVFVLVLRLILKRRAPKQVVCLLWLVVFVRLLIPVTIEAPFSLVPREVTGAVEAIGAVEEVPGDPGPVQSLLPGADPAPTLGVQPVITLPPTGQSAPMVTLPPVSTEPPGQTVITPEPTPAAEPFPWATAITALWAVGVLAMLAWGTVSYLSLRRRVFNAVRTEKGVWEHPAVTAPFILGLFRPKIYLPMGIEGLPRQFILRHEQAHLRRRDYIVKPVCWLALAVHWFNPLAWVAFLLMSRDIETACDESVLQELGAEVKADYSATLLALATERKFPSPTPLSFGEGDAKVRIKNVVRFKKPALWVTVVAVAVVVVAALCLLTDREGAEEPGSEPSLPPVVESEPPAGESEKPVIESDPPVVESDPPVTESGPVPVMPVSPKVTPLTDGATEDFFTRFQLTCDGKEITFTGKAVNNDMRAVDGVYTADLDGDGGEEIIVVLTVGYGTGYLGQELHVFDRATLEEHPAEGLAEELAARFTFTSDEANFYIAADGFSAVIAKAETGAYELLDRIFVGEDGRFTVEQGKLFYVQGCCVGNFAVYYGELWTELTLENGALVPADDELRGVKGLQGQELALDLYSRFLQGQVPIAPSWGGDRYYLSGLQRMITPSNPEFTIAPTMYALVDMDGDGIVEMVTDLVINGDASADAGFLILRLEADGLHAYHLSHRSFRDCKADGTFFASGSAFDGYICRLNFDPAAEDKLDRITYHEEESPHVQRYVVNRQPATEAEFDAAYSAWLKQEPIRWVDIATGLVQVDPDWEPLMDEEALSVAAPDFLTAEQQSLYLRARKLYGMLFGANVAERLTDGYQNCQWVTIDGINYVIGGRYSDWTDFEAVVYALFTDNFWQTRNNQDVFVEYEGKTAIMDGGMGAGYYYNPNFPDTFALVSSTEDEIVFTVTGHYTQVWPIEGMTYEERDEYRRTTCEYTYDFTIRMVRTEAGWRFGEFHSPQTDEKAPEDTGVIVVNERPAVWEPAPDPAADAFLAALRDEVVFLQYEPKYREEITATLSEFLSVTGPQLSIKDMALVDMDGDGQQELLLWVGTPSLKYYGTEILRYDPEMGTLTGYMIRTRGMYYVREDGTFEYDNSSADGGIARLSFTAQGYTTEYLIWRKEENRVVRYYINGASVSEAEWEAAVEAHMAEVDEVVLTEYSLEAAEKLLGR